MAEELFNDAFIEQLNENPHEDLLVICQRIIDFHYQQETKGISQKDWYDEYLRSYAFLEVYAEGLDVGFTKINFGNNINNNIESIRIAIGKIKASLEVKKTAIDYDSAKEKYSLKLKKGFAYEFSGDDLKRIQKLIKRITAINN